MGKIDFNLIREAARSDLIRLLNEISGTKAIVWDPEIMGRFELIGDGSFFTSQGVTNMFYLNNENLPKNSIKNIIFITRPNKDNMNMINNQIRMETASNISFSKEYHLWCIPRLTFLCQETLQQHGVYSTFISIKEIPIYLFKLDSDLISLELPFCYRDIHLHHNPTSIHSTARAIMTIQALYGFIPNIYGKGIAAKNVFELIVNMRRELGGNEPQVAPQIDQLILIDRSVDLISPLATQLTYEGLIDQFIGIKNCRIKMPSNSATSNRLSPSIENSANSELNPLLNSDNSLFGEIRDFNFFAVGPRLSSEAKEVSTMYDKKRTANSVQDLKKFVQNLPQIQVAKQSLSIQTTIAETIQQEIMSMEFRASLQCEQEMIKGSDTDKVNQFIENCIIQRKDLIKVLRLICLQNVINNGFKAKVFEFYKKEIIYTYGYEHFLTLDNLERIGLFCLQQGKNSYSAIRKTLRLTVEDVNETRPQDASYVHSGYAPLSIRLVEFLHSLGWRAITEVLNLLPGPTLCETQQLPSALRQRRSSGGSIQGSSSDASTCLVCFVGGCTYAEVAALRFIANRLDQGGPEYVIMTSKMINAKTFLENLNEPLNSSRKL